MAKKKETLTLDEIRRCANLYFSFHNAKRIEVEMLAKELGVKKLDLWEYISKHEEYFVMHCWSENGGEWIKYRFITEVLETPMTDEELLNMKIEYCYQKDNA